MRTFAQEYQKFKVFTDSLLSRNSKLVELISQLENELIENGKSENSPEAKRVGKPHAQHSSFLWFSSNIRTDWNILEPVCVLNLLYTWRSFLFHSSPIKDKVQESFRFQVSFVFTEASLTSSPSHNFCAFSGWCQLLKRLATSWRQSLGSVSRWRLTLRSLQMMIWMIWPKRGNLACSVGSMLKNCSIPLTTQSFLSSVNSCENYSMIISSWEDNWLLSNSDTVDGKNPAPIRVPENVFLSPPKKTFSGTRIGAGFFPSTVWMSIWWSPNTTQIIPNPLRLLKKIDAQIRNTTVKCLVQAIWELLIEKKSSQQHCCQT